MKQFSVLLVIIFWGCSTSNDHSKTSLIKKNELKYAKGFTMEHRDGKTYIEVYNPWDNYSLLASYELSNDSANKDPRVIKVPIDRTVCLSSTYLGMLALLGAQETVVASSNANWIYDSLLYASYLNGDIDNLGNDLSISAESVLAQKPGAVLKYIYQSPDPIDPIIINAGIPLIYIIEFMEEHPLGRTEWIKLVGALLDKQELADSIFTQIESNYNNYKNLAAKSKSKPKVLEGCIYKGTWYAAGGKSFVAQLLKDANANYYWFSDSTTGSIPVGFEVVVKNQEDADFWINSNAFSLDEVLSVDARCNVFKAFQNENVYHYNKRINPKGGLDYYESGVVRPDLLLQDLLVILHPELIEAETVYYKKLEYTETH